MNTPLRALIIEDVDDDTMLLLRELRRSGFVVSYEQVSTLADLRVALDQHGWDVIISDYSLPGFNGLMALQLVQERGIDIPFIIVSGTIGEETAVAAMRAGARDYLMKGQLARLGPTVAREMREADDRQARRRAEQTLFESEARYRAVVEQASDGICLVDVSTGRIMESNAALQRILGMTADELACRTPTDLFGNCGAGTNARLNGAADPLPHHTKQLFRRKDGTSVNIEVSANHLTSGGRSIMCIVVRDVTLRKQRERELEAFTQVATALRAAANRMDMLPIILDHTMSLLNADGAAIAGPDPATSALVVELARGAFGELGDGINEFVVSTGAPYVCNDVRLDRRVAPMSRLDSLRAVAGTPLIAEGQTVGVLWIVRQQPISADELRLLIAIGDIAANAIRRTTLHEQTQQRLQRLGALHAIQVAIGASLDLRVTLTVVLDHVTSQLRVDAATVLLLTPHTRMLEYAAGRGFRSGTVARTRVRLGESLAGRAALEYSIQRIANPLGALPVSVHGHLVDDEHFCTYYAVPLIAKGEVTGVLNIFHRTLLYPDQEWFDFLESLAAQAAIAIDNAALFESLERSNAALVLAYDTTLEGWSRALDLRDKETEGHTRRVTEMTVMMARAIGVRDEELVHIQRGALLHDIGKMGIPDSILLKPGPLTEEEWVVMHKHPTYAYELLAPIPFLRRALDIPYCHHEKWDGTGYPRGLSGEAIPLAARIFAVVDVWDALRSDRPYRPGWPEERVREHIKNLSGTHFDPRIVEVFLKHV
jgi:PAS domain S-box-containing protein